MPFSVSWQLADHQGQCLQSDGGHRTNIDDAAGEAFDKCAKVMGLGYPGGPVLNRLANEGDPKAFTFSKPHISGYDYSFSG